MSWASLRSPFAKPAGRYHLEALDTTVLRPGPSASVLGADAVSPWQPSLFPCNDLQIRDLLFLTSALRIQDRAHPSPFRKSPIMCRIETIERRIADQMRGEYAGRGMHGEEIIEPCIRRGSS